MRDKRVKVTSRDTTNLVTLIYRCCYSTELGNIFNSIIAL